jgi:hypothetical protein
MDAIVTWDQFDFLMIEQPLWADDFYFHSMLQKRMETAICLDESIRNRRDALAAIDMESCQIINIKCGRVGGFSEAIAVHNVAQERGIRVWCGGMLETGIGRSHNIALSSLPNFSLPGDVSASKRYWKEDIIDPVVEVSKGGQIAFPMCPDAASRCAPTWWSGSRCGRKKFAPCSWSRKEGPCVFRDVPQDHTIYRPARISGWSRGTVKVMRAPILTGLSPQERPT